MPLYDYSCSCGHHLEINKKIADRDDVSDITCPECTETGHIKRELSSPLVGYSITVNGGYGSKVPDGFREVLKRVDERAPGSRMKETSSFL